MPYTTNKRVISFSVTITVPVPFHIVENIVSDNCCPYENPSFKKINAIKELRSAFKEMHGVLLGLKDAKEIVEETYSYLLQE